ncbi:peptidyl-prolyl cis-trans isomerase [candidate division WOR-3 bacterium]|nr:peptidyl-prolyl cis-trans isomerase [candidate division WOR-3 bacterium]
MPNLRRLWAIIFLFVIGCSYENKTLLTVGDSKYTVADFKEVVQFTPAVDSATRMRRVEDFVDQMCVVEEARAAGYENDQVVRAAYETNRRDIVWRSYYGDVVLGKVKVKDSEVRGLYNKIVDQYHLAQIVVDEESLATYLTAELKKGTPFEDLLAYSLDTMSENGDIGTFSVISIPPEIMTPLKKVRRGGVTDAIKFGEFYMIFKVIEHSIAETPTFEEIKDNIKSNLWQERAAAEAETYVEDVLKRAKVEYNPQGLEILAKPESLVTQDDLSTWVVKKYDTSYVYVRSVIDAVRHLSRGARIDPKRLIEQELIPDLIYDEAVKNYHDRRITIKRKIDNAYTLLLYQKFYSDHVTGAVTVDSAEVREYFRLYGDEFKDTDMSKVHPAITARLRDAKVDSMRSGLFEMLRAKYGPVVNQGVLAGLLREEK